VLALSGTAYAFGQAPVANFRGNVLSGCAPLTVAFTDLSTGNPTEWNWEFSNGTLSNVKNPVVAFANPGTYSVKLVVRNAEGIDQIERIDYITVFPSPIADFGADITLGCLPVTVKFTDHSSTPAGTIVKWEWEFGDGNISSQPSPSHTYSLTGFYTVSLRVTSSTGCVRRISRSRYIRVVDGVTTDFNFSLPASCKPPFVVNFQNQSSGPGTVSYAWNFGNGQTSTATNPIVIFNAPGTYNVRLNALSNLGCGGTITKQVVITQTNTDFTGPTTVCLEVPAAFQNNSSAVPATSFWDFGDGTTSAQINPVKTFLTPGVYTVKLINTY
jgi:PKD repeat protein